MMAGWASVLENIVRQDADEMTQYETYTRLIAEGKTPAEIARTVGLEVKQRSAWRLAISRQQSGIYTAMRKSVLRKFDC
jgi:hypothetical protein